MSSLAFNCQTLHHQIRSYYLPTPLFLEKDHLRGLSQIIPHRRLFDIARGAQQPNPACNRSQHLKTSSAKCFLERRDEQDEMIDKALVYIWTSQVRKSVFRPSFH